jgi:hypothetical protein
MKKIRSIQIIFLGTLLSASFGSCKRFLDTPAPQQLSAQTVLSSEQGFKDALSAVYLQMGDQSLYGREMTMGLLSVMGRSYDTTITPKVGSLYYQGAAYNFQDPTVQAAIKTIWNNSYQCIGELNNLLSQVDSKKNLFTGNDYYDLKAEATALRAFLHFDLLRLFGPAQAGQNLSVPVLPYMKKLTPYAQPVNTDGDVLDSCIADLNTATGLFRDSAVTTAHLNYWGVKALLARIYLYEGDLADAQTYALQLIGSNKYPLAISNADALFSSEHIFNIYVFQNNLLAYLKSLFNTPTPMGLQTTSQTALYVNATTDWRKSGAFLDPTSNSTVGTTIMPKKLSSSVIGANNVMPMIRMTEMYYIAAECAQQLNGDFTQATAWLDSVRVHRGVTKYGLAALPHDSITAEIGREYRREMLGEGQVFYYFKRNNLPFSTLPLQKVAPVANASYVLPKPE